MLSYRIVFEPSRAFWVIELSQIRLLWTSWRRIRCLEPDEPIYQDMQFASYSDAVKFAEEVGLDQVYQRVQTGAQVPTYQLVPVHTV